MAFDQTLQVSRSITIDAPTVDVWSALTDPEKIKLYFFGAETITDWKVGSPIVFQGEVQGQRWQDKGCILECDRGIRLRYSYWSGFCGLEDVPENYGTVTYSLAKSGKGTQLTVLQQGYANKKSRESSESGWAQVLGQIKDIAEG